MELKYGFRVEEFTPQMKENIVLMLTEQEQMFESTMAIPPSSPKYKFREQKLESLKAEMEKLRYWLEVYDEASAARSAAKVYHLPASHFGAATEN